MKHVTGFILILSLLSVGCTDVIPKFKNLSSAIDNPSDAVTSDFYDFKIVDNNNGHIDTSVTYTSETYDVYIVGCRVSADPNCSQLYGPHKMTKRVDLYTHTIPIGDSAPGEDLKIRVFTAKAETTPIQTLEQFLTVGARNDIMITDFKFNYASMSSLDIQVNYLFDMNDNKKIVFKYCNVTQDSGCANIKQVAAGDITITAGTITASSIIDFQVSGGDQIKVNMHITDDDGYAIEPGVSENIYHTIEL